MASSMTWYTDTFLYKTLLLYCLKNGRQCSVFMISEKSPCCMILGFVATICLAVQESLMISSKIFLQSRCCTELHRLVVTVLFLYTSKNVLSQISNILSSVQYFRIIPASTAVSGLFFFDLYFSCRAFRLSTVLIYFLLSKK